MRVGKTHVMMGRAFLRACWLALGLQSLTRRSVQVASAQLSVLEMDLHGPAIVVIIAGSGCDSTTT